MSEHLPHPSNIEPNPQVVAAEQAVQPDHGEVQLVHDAAQELQQVPQPETLGSETFVQKRAGTLRGVWNKAKAVAGKIGEYFAIEHEGYRLSPLENIKTRFANFAVIGKAINAGSEGGADIMNNWREHNPALQSAVQRHRERQYRQTRSSDENFADRRLFADTAKIAAYELTTLPVVRMAGLMALHGAAKVAEKVTGSNAAAKVQEKAAYRLEIHEQGLHNPTVRKLNGVKWSEIRPSNKAPKQPPLVDRRTTDLSAMHPDTVVRYMSKNPFTDDEPREVVTTAGALRNPWAEHDEVPQQSPRAKIKAKAGQA